MKTKRMLSGVFAVLLGMMMLFPAAAKAATPNPPENFKATPHSTTASFTWSASSGAATYELYEINAAGKQATWVGSTKKTSMTIKNMEPDTKYRFAIRAVDPNGKASKWSSILDVRTEKRMPAPKNVKATRASDKKSYTVTWDEAKDAKKYQIFSVASDGTTVYLGSSTKNSFKHPTNEVTNYCVRSISEYGDEGTLGVQVGVKVDGNPRVDTNPNPKSTPKAASVPEATKKPNRSAS